MATYLLSQKPSKMNGRSENELTDDILMNAPVLADQQKLAYINSVQTLNAV